MTKRRVVVTGLGSITPVGLDVKSTWEAILASKSGVGMIDAFDASNLPVRICAAVKNFDPAPYLEPKEARKNDLFVQFAIAAATQAIVDAGLEQASDLERIGVSIGAGIGGLPFIEKNYLACIESGARRVSPFFIPGAIINMASGVVAIKYGFKGPNLAIVTACSTGAHNIGNSARLISYGDADVMVAGGCEMSTTILGLGGFMSARTLSKRNDAPEKASRPWDRDRDGFVMGEGAGVLVLEEYEHARKRGAHIYAELAGYGMSDDGYHITAPEPTGIGAALAMQNALNDAGLAATDIQYINAHGTSTGIGDPIEVSAIKKVFGDYAYKLAVSSTKSMVGHLLGAAGAVEAIFTILALRDQIAPPTINLDHPDEGCDLDFVPHHARKMKIDAAVSNSFGFGGTNAALIFKKFLF